MLDLVICEFIKYYSIFNCFLFLRLLFVWMLSQLISLLYIPWRLLPEWAFHILNIVETLQSLDFRYRITKSISFHYNAKYRGSTIISCHHQNILGFTSITELFLLAAYSNIPIR